MDSFIDKLLMLEEKTGARVQYQSLDPLPTASYNLVTIQRAAKEMAHFIGLDDFTFIISIIKQKENVGGHVDLATTGSEVFIEIDDELLESPEVCSAALAHEICHKWMDHNEIRSPIERDNEILTDITAVYLGFGKILLNGCETIRVSYEEVSGGTRTIHKTRKVGYLDRKQLAIVYRLVCAMRDLDQKQFTQGLTASSLQAIKECEHDLRLYFDPRNHHQEAIQDVIDSLHADVSNFQKHSAELDKCLVYIQESFVNRLKETTRAQHRKIVQLRQEAARAIQASEHDPALRYLRNIKRLFSVFQLREDALSIVNDAAAFLAHAKKLGQSIALIDKQYGDPEAKMFNLIQCPLDGTKLRLPENSGDIRVTCPTCEYQFVFNTDPPSFLLNQPKPTGDPERVRNQSWFKKFLKKKS